MFGVFFIGMLFNTIIFLVWMGVIRIFSDLSVYFFNGILMELFFSDGVGHMNVWEYR